MSAPIHLSDLAKLDRPLSSDDFVDDFFIKFVNKSRERSTTSFLAEIYDSQYVLAEVLTKHGMSPIARFQDDQINPLIIAIQKGDLNKYYPLTMFVQEASVKYSGEDPNYYLQLIVNEPGQSVKLSRSTRKVPACKACDALMLNYSYEWIFQREDHLEENCPYCGVSLKMIKRESKIVPVELDYDATNLQLNIANYQVGVLYREVPIKLTVKFVALYHLFLNLQALSHEGVIGPLKGRFVPRGKYVVIEDITPIKIKQEQVEWRPAVLFPEDLISF